MAPLLNDLNDAQREAVTHTGGPLLVVAGPGTGKTKTLICSIAYLVQEKRGDPNSVLAITFTHRAAREMRERLVKLLDEKAAFRCFIGTFHALGFFIIQEEARSLSFKSKPVLYDEEDQKALLKEVLLTIQPKASRSALEEVKFALESCLNRDLPLSGSAASFDLNEVYQIYTQK